MKKFNIAIVGLGGQGIVTLGTVMKNAALSSDLQDVSGSERRGGAQREGYVETFVKYIFYENESELNDLRKNMHSPMIESGGANVLISLEPLETLRGARYLNKNSIVIFNQIPHIPISVRMGQTTYPEISFIVSELKKITENIFLYDFDKISAENFNSLTQRNIIALGALFARADIPISVSAVENILMVGKGAEDNLKAFKLGLEL
ncbi:MAG: 2-oxoacid:acceptor oxidoreductase family protein [bacterium]